MVKKGKFGEKAGIAPWTIMQSTLTTDALFSGQSDYTLDDKGRLTVQRDWRMEGVEGETLHLVPDSKGTCLRVMRPDRFVQFGEEAREQPGMDAKKHRLFMRNFFSNSTAVTMDKQGRIMIPADYCTRLKLKGSVRVLGCGDLFEVWNKKMFEEHHAEEQVEYNHYADALGL